MALSSLPLFLAAIIHTTSVYSHPLAEKRAGGSKIPGASGSDALVLDDYSAENEDANHGIQMTQTNIIIISVVSGVSFILIVGSIFLFCWLRRSRKRKAARTSFSEETQYTANNGMGEHHQELKTDENQPLYPQINFPPQHTQHAHHAHHASNSSYISHGSHASHDSTHDPHLSLLSAYDHPPPVYSNGNSPPNQYSPLHNHGVAVEPSFPAPTAAPSGLPHLSPPSGGEADAYYGR
ncbi:hypothetical protein FQN54_004612 [Arachnomyces sp. PD_36]|nr:hypothetical protein FQN54_004612 [Arachnomyces sp. PD_36]